MRRDDGAEPQVLVSVPNILGLNPKSVCSANDVNAYVLLVVICPWDGYVKPGSSLVLFDKSMLMSVPGSPSPFFISHLSLIHIHPP